MVPARIIPHPSFQASVRDVHLGQSRDPKTQRLPLVRQQALQLIQ
jgi:hypothetical protein